MNIGIIGCGNISATYLKLGPMFKGVNITQIADLNMEVAQARAAEFGVAAVSVDDLLASSEIDVVVNLTIPAAHFDVTSDILDAGKHAYSEKPLVLSLEDGKRLKEISAQTGLRVGSAPDTFLGGAHQQARALLDAGELGDITAGTAHVMNHGMEGWHPNPDFFFQPGAGPMLDIGPYYVTNLIQLLGPVARVAALTSSATKTRTIGSEPRRGDVIPVETPTNIHALLEFASGPTVTLSTSWDIWAHRHGHMELYGTEGSLFLPDPNFFGGDLARSGRSVESVPVEPWDHPFGRLNDGTRANYRCAGLADMVQAVETGRDHRCSIDLALHATDVMTSVLKSGEDRAFVEMTTTCSRPDALDPVAAAELLRGT